MQNDYKYKITQTSLFKKTRKLAVKRGLNISSLEKIIEQLAKGSPLPIKNKDHQLKGRLKEFRECHIEPDWLLVYRIIEDKLVLVLSATGSHTDLFDKNLL